MCNDAELPARGTYVSDKTVHVAVQMKDCATYVRAAAVLGITAASDAVGNCVSEFVGSAVGRETALPGKPGEVMRVDTLPPLPFEKETFGSAIPRWPGEPVESIGGRGRRIMGLPREAHDDHAHAHATRTADRVG